MVEDAAITKYVETFEALRATSLSFLKAVYDHDFLPQADFNYPCVTFDWADSGRIRITGNQASQEIYIDATMYEADGVPVDAHRRLRTYLRPFQEALKSVKGGSSDNYSYSFEPGPTKPGQRIGGDGTHTAAAFCRITVKLRGPS